MTNIVKCGDKEGKWFYYECPLCGEELRILIFNLNPVSLWEQVVMCKHCGCGAKFETAEPLDGEELLDRFVKEHEKNAFNWSMRIRGGKVADGLG